MFPTYPLSPMSEIEKTLKQQLSRTALQQQTHDAYRALADKRFQLIGLAAAMAMVQAGFSDGDDFTPDDELRARTLSNNETTFDQLAKEVASLSAKHARLHKQLCASPCPDC